MTARPAFRQAALALASLAALVTTSCHRRTASPGLDTSASFQPEPVPEFTLTERSGKPVSRSDLLGKVWVASFVFTRCTGPCPQVTATVARLQGELKDQPDVRFVTFTVDPQRDKPDELKRYADHFKADPERWLFLTGEEATIHQLLTKGFLVAAGRSQEAKPPVGQEFDHSTLLVVVDKLGNIPGYSPGYRSPDGGRTEQEFEDTLRQFRAKVVELAREGGGR
jgi:cytochrome oxidase Cu insertion factor (SCO1/SenC/PrrC family)